MPLLATGGVGVRVEFGIRVGVLVSEAVGVKVSVSVAVSVGVAVGVSVGTGVEVGAFMRVGVALKESCVAGKLSPDDRVRDSRPNKITSAPTVRPIKMMKRLERRFGSGAWLDDVGEGGIVHDLYKLPISIISLPILIPKDLRLRRGIAALISAPWKTIVCWKEVVTGDG